MDSPDSAQVAAVVGALGAVFALLASSRLVLLTGFAFLAISEAGLGLARIGVDTPGRIGQPAVLALGGVGALAIAAGAAALVRWPSAIIPLVLAAAPFRLPFDVATDHRFLLSVSKSGELGRLLPLYAVLAVASVALVVQALRGDSVVALPHVLAVPTAALAAFAALSLLWTFDLDAGIGALAFFLIPFVVLVCVVGRAPFAPWLLKVLAVIAVALGTLFATIGIWQAATKELFFFAPNLEVANTYSPIFRVTSLFRDPSLYGRHVVLGIAVLVVLLWMRRVNVLLAVALIAVMWTGLYFSYSQSSFAALFVVVLAVTAVAGGRRIRVAVASATVLLLLAGSVLVAREIADDGLRRATSDRSRRVELTARVIADHPVAGVGLGGQPRASQQLSERPGPKQNFVSHSAPLTVGAELGAVGLALYVVFLAGAAMMLAAVWRLEPAFGLVLGSSLLALLVHSLFYSGFFEDPITWLVLGLGASFLAARPQPVAEPAPAAAPRAEAVAAR